ncbi:hypothetical protein SPFL3102_02661 [Sporomusaceae bacterium FL31]|nr:hypothetical protein SPFL3101_02636 [Sporomusaceae bacterium FL31]GCE34834.1 hypothetical protein SPFL3102_02661 [Sporomusaceae bacterium]
MRMERINKIVGSRYITESGAKRTIGNFDPQVGDFVWTHGDVIFGHQAPQNTARPVIHPKQYKFADSHSLMMYYTNINITRVEKTKPIIPPDLSAKLLLHCYNKSIEYLVWIWPTDDDLCKCLIQRNGVAIEEFISVYPAVPECSDAYIDDDGNLIWVAETNTYIDESVFILAKYSNNTLIDSRLFTYSLLKSAMENDIANIMNTAYDNTTITTSNQQETTEVYTCCISPNTVFGIEYEAKYDSKQALPDSLYRYASFYTYIVDLWNLDMYVLLGGNGNYQAGIHTAATTYDRFTGEPTDNSYLSGEYLLIAAELTRRYKSSDSSVVAESQIIDPNNLSMTTSHQYSFTSTLVRTGSGSISGHVVYDDVMITKTMFTASISFSTDQADLAQCVLTFTSGPNQGKSRTIDLPPYYGSGGIFYLRFNSAWDYTPLINDTFSISVAFATRTITEITADFTFTVSGLESSIVNESPDILTDLGSGYQVKQVMLAIGNGYEPEFTWEIDYNSEKIFDGGNAYVSMQPKAWCVKNNALTGLLPESGRVIKAKELSVVTTEAVANLFNNNIVTKRFCEY